MKNYIFQIFGSHSSADYDIMVFVDTIPSVEDSKQLTHKLDYYYYMFFSDNGLPMKKVNSNLAVLKDGVIVQVYKGTSDECSNSCYLTYDEHQQFHPKQIERLVKRDIDLKAMRTARVILSFLSRSDMRMQIKNALQNNFIEKIKLIDTMDLTRFDENNYGKNVDFVDVCKILAFQFSQTIALIDGKEYYTKEDLAKNYPDLKDMLFRTKTDLSILEKYKQIFVSKCKKLIPTMKTYNEYKI
jgi:hypothetical protein